MKRDWAREQLQVYEDAGEHDLAEEYRENLARKERLNGECEREQEKNIISKSA